MNIWAIILAGGRGTRFWPKSRESLPKQCLDFGDGETLLEKTINRILPFIPEEKIIVITGNDMVDSVKSILKDFKSINLVIEQSPRNTLPPVALATKMVKENGGTHCVVMPSDHSIADEDKYIQVLRQAVYESDKHKAIALLGMNPNVPHTGYGYIQGGKIIDDNIFYVKKFIEKPDLKTATKIFKRNDIFWNAGVFVYPVKVWEEELELFAPKTFDAINNNNWEHTDKTSVDYGVLEKTRNLIVLPCEVGWNDLGSWTSLEGLLPEIPGGIGNAETIEIDSNNNIIDAKGRRVVLLGVEELVIVDTGDVLFVTKKQHSQKVGEIVTKIKSQGIKIT